MADVAVLTLRIASSQAEAAAKRTDATLERLDKSAKSVTQSFRRMGIGLTAAVTAPFALAARSAVKASAEFEKARISFGVFLQDMDLGARKFDEIVQLAAKTPLNVGTLQSAAQMLLATGAATANSLIPTLTALGNLARADSGILQRLSLNLGQVATQGKLTGRELRDFAVAGVPLLQTLAKQMGKDTKAIADMVSKGKIGFAQVTQAFKAMTDEGGRFNGLMEKLSQTLAGRWTTAVDNIRITLSEFADVFREEMKAVLDIVIRVAEWFRNLSPQVKRLIVVVAGIAAAVGPILLAIAGLGAVFAGITTAIAGLVPLIPILLKIAATLGIVATSAEGVRRAFDMTWTDVLNGAGEFVSKVTGFFLNFRENAGLIINWFKNNWSKLWRNLITNTVKVLRNLWTNFKILINGISQILGVFIGWGLDKFKEFTTKAMNTIARWARNVVVLFKDLGNSIAEALRRGFTGRVADTVDLTPFSKFLKGAADSGTLLERLQNTIADIDFVPLTAGVKWDVEVFPKLNTEGFKKAGDAIFGILRTSDIQKFQNDLLRLALATDGVVPELGETGGPSAKLAQALESGTKEAFNLLTAQRDDPAKKTQKKNLNANQKSAFELSRLNTDGVQLKGVKSIGTFR